jgi:FkbM family methyltransferase
MRLLIHAIYIVIKILTTKNECGRFSILKTYVSLLFRSVVHHKVTRQAGISRVKLLDFYVHFINHSELLTLFEEIFVYQIYHFSSSDLNPLIIDAGSNIGLSALYFKTVFPNARVICIEPDDENFDLLKLNIEANGLSGVTAKCAALSNITGKNSLYKRHGAGSLNATLIKSNNDVVEGEVDCILLSDLIKEPVDLLKLDVEGSEAKILEDLLIRSKLPFIKQMIIEHHPFLTGHPTEEMVMKIKNAGFECRVAENNVHLPVSDPIMYCKQAAK